VVLCRNCLQCVQAVALGAAVQAGIYDGQVRWRRCGSLPLTARRSLDRPCWQSQQWGLKTLMLSLAAPPHACRCLN
jgi:hypothetical protein